MDKPTLLIAAVRFAARSALFGTLALALVACENPVTKDFKQDPGQKTPANNNAPTISAISNVTIAQDSFASVDFTIKDLDGPLSCQTSVFVSASDNSLLPPTGVVKSGQAPDCHLKLIPSAGYFGSGTVRVEVSDGSHSAYSSFTLTVAEGDPAVIVSNASANEGSNVNFTVQLSHSSPVTKTVTYATSDNTALNGTHYTGASGTLTFTPGQTSKTVSVATAADGVYAPNRTFYLAATSAGVTSTATGTIVNTDAAPTASAANASANEGSNITFTVNLNRASTANVNVTYATSDVTAAAGTNYTATSGTLTFLPGETSKTLTVATTADGVYSPNLTFDLALTANGTTNNATGTVVNTDALPTASAANVSANEGSGLTFTVNLDRAATTSTTVTYATSNGTASAGTNYTAASGTLTFTAGQTSKTVTVTSADDNVYTADLTFTLSMTANGTTNTATGTIVNIDTAPVATVANSSANEGSAITFTVNLNRASSTATSVTYATSDGTAAAGTNYTATSGTLTFNAGETSKNVSVPTTHDSIYTANLTLTFSVTANSTTNTATGTVNNTDTAPTASAANASANEGSSITFTVNLDHASSSSTSVTYATSNGTATAGTNYTSTSGTLTFAAGETSKTVTVPTIDDGIYTADLTFTLSMTANSTTNTATGTITNTTTAPVATVSNVSANEGSNLVFTVSLDHASSTSTTVTYATADGTAIAGTNYTAASGSLTFTAGQTSKTVTVASADDNVYTANLTFTLSATANSTTNSGTGTITNTDTAPTATVANASANEGSPVTFTVTLNRASSSTTSVTYSTSDGTGVAGTNYTSGVGTISFAAGETSKTVNVNTTHDNVYTPNLTFTIDVTANSTTNSATGTITNTDTAPTASASNASANEGSSITFTVNLNHASSSSTSVTYATSNGTATAGTNYTTASGTLTFAAGETSKTVTVATTDDGIYTADLTFTLSMTANSTTNTATGTVVNTTTAPVATVSSVSANEGSNLVFTVTLDHASGSNTSVNYATADGTAVAGTNYTAASGTLSFTAGQTSKTVTVASLADSTYTANLTFTLSATVNSTTNSGTGTINNTDSVPTVAISAGSAVVEGNNATFTFTLNHASSTAITVDYATASGTATSGSDFTATSGTATIAAGALSTSVNVPTADDNADEQDETFTMAISNPSGATLGTSSATMTIQDTALYFNFMGGTLPSGMTFSRASSATYFDSSGVMQTVAAGTPRFDYDPSSCSGSCTLRGLLIEESRTNLLLQSAAFGTTWVANNATVTNNTTISPNGGTNAETVASNSNTVVNSDRVSQNVTVAASTSYVLSFFVKNSTSSQSKFELSAPNSGTTGKTVTITWTGATPSLSAGTATALPDSWYRVEVPFTTNGSDAGSATVSFYPANSVTDNLGEVYLWGAQLEAGATATSYIATAASTVTRAADSLAVSNFGTWFNPTAWTAILDFSRPEYEASSAATTPVLFSSCDDTNGTTCAADHFEAIHLPSDNTFRGRSWVSSSNVATSTYTNAANLAGTKVQLAVSQTANGELQTVFNGTAATISGTASKPNLYNFVLGGAGMAGAYTNQLNGHLKKFTYRQRALTAAQMQAMTSD